ncbi:hypothetical protein BDK51DRAFT_19650, partial [Blyttiomyces helicus]
WSDKTESALALLRSQNRYFAIVEIKRKPFFVHLRDMIITDRMKDLQIGDELILDRVREIGSDDFILRGNPYVDPKYFTLKTVVIEHTPSMKMLTIHKKRVGKDKLRYNHAHHTMLRVTEISINERGTGGSLIG